MAKFDVKKTKISSIDYAQGAQKALVYNTVLTAEKRGPQIVGAQIAGVYCILISGTFN